MGLKFNRGKTKGTFMPTGMLFLVVGESKSSTIKPAIVTPIERLPPDCKDLHAQLLAKKGFDADEIWASSFQGEHVYHCVRKGDGTWTTDQDDGS